MQKNGNGLLPYTIHKINSKCIKDMNVELEMIKLLEKNMAGELLDIGWQWLFKKKSDTKNKS